MRCLILLTTLVCACTGPKADDTGELGGDTDGSDFAFDNFQDSAIYGSCADSVCIYRVTLTQAPSMVEVDMTETGDAALYNENHNGFQFEKEEENGSLTYRLDLDWVTDIDDVVVNETTLFNPDVADGAVLDRTTWYFGASGPDMLDFDCIVLGDDPSYYRDWCDHLLE